MTVYDAKLAAFVMTRTIQRKTDTEYGSAANGIHVGTGYDVVIKRETKRTALLNVVELSTETEWLGPIDVDADRDLQALAVEIGNCPGAWISGLASNDPDDKTEGWDEYVARWNTIGMRRAAECVKRLENIL